MSDDGWGEVRGGAFPREWIGLPGLEQLRRLFNGGAEPPPIGHLTGVRPTEVGVGTATFTMPVTGWLKTPQGVVSAGEVAVLADAPLGCAVHTGLPPATGYTTAELSINMVRPVPPSGQLVARGRLVHGGRQLGLSEVFVTDDAGRLVAHGTSRCVVFPPVPDVPPPPDDAVVPTPAASAPDDDGWVPPYLRPVRGEVVGQEVWSTRSGLEVMQAFLAGELPAPPVSHLLGSRPVEVAEGSCTFTMPASGWLVSPTGFVQGGATACLADFAMAGAVQTTVPAGCAYAPTELRVQFVRPVPADGGLLRARGTVEHRGRSVAFSRAEVRNAQGKLVALAHGSAMVLPGRRADLSDGPALG